MSTEFLKILRTICSEAGNEWENRIPAAPFAQRIVTHESTGCTPSELIHGKNLRTPLALLYEKWIDPLEERGGVFE